MYDDVGDDDGDDDADDDDGDDDDGDDDADDDDHHEDDNVADDDVEDDGVQEDEVQDDDVEDDGVQEDEVQDDGVEDEVEDDDVEEDEEEDEDENAEDEVGDGDVEDDNVAKDQVEDVAQDEVEDCDVEEKKMMRRRRKSRLVFLSVEHTPMLGSKLWTVLGLEGTGLQVKEPTLLSAEIRFKQSSGLLDVDLNYFLTEQATPSSILRKDLRSSGFMAGSLSLSRSRSLKRRQQVWSDWVQSLKSSRMSPKANTVTSSKSGNFAA
eukprot:s386_g29.t1